jgi:hypothetical protein
VEIRKLAFPNQPGQKVREIPSQAVKAGHGDACLSSSYTGNINRRIVSQVGPGVKHETLSQK